MGIIELAPSSISWEVRAFSLARVLISAAAVVQSIDSSRLAYTCFSGAGAFDEQPATSANSIIISVMVFIGHLQLLIRVTLGIGPLVIIS